MTTEDIVTDVLEILGTTEDDEFARTWILATLDDDEEWFSFRSAQTIRLAYEIWRRGVS
jgi:hypothetical protein